MKRKIATACLGVSFCTAAVSGQVLPNSDSTDNSANIPGPIAYVYVSARIGASSRTEVQAFSAAPNGRLTPLQGSPFAADVTFMAVNGLYLFGSDSTGTHISAYSINSDGSLRYATSTDVVQPGNGCDSPGAIFFDHSGATLYNVDYFAMSCSGTAYQSLAVRKVSGELAPLNEAEVGLSGTLLSFIGNNKYAYGADCVKSTPRVYGYMRTSDGSLKSLHLDAPFPEPPVGMSWCPETVASDSTNHLAVPMYPSAGSRDRSGPDQLATYTVQSDGTLTTSSTAGNMPAVAVGSLTNIHMAPSGKLIALAGTGGLQIFHFNGGDPVTPYTGLIVKQEVDQIFWDNNDHLYAISQSTGKLWVFTVTPASCTQSPGSPYSIHGPLNIAVQPWPLPWSTSVARAASKLHQSVGLTLNTFAAID